MNKVRHSGINYSVSIFLSLFIFLFTLNFVSSLEVSQWDYDPLDVSGNNYSINVNNTEFHRGLTPQQVANLINTTGLVRDWNSTGLIINWSKLIQPFNLQEVLTAGNTANVSIVLENTETDPYCQGTPTDTYCYNNYFTQEDCDAYTGHNNQCYWLPYGECGGDTFSYCYFTYSDESSCNADPHGCYWGGSECYPTYDCQLDFSSDETTCNSAYGGMVCGWTDYSYCENTEPLSCSQVGEDECDVVAGCDYETDVEYKTITTAQINLSAPTGLAPMIVSSITKVVNLNTDLFDGFDSSDFLKSTTTGLTLPALSNGKFLKSGASSLSWESAVEGSVTKYGTPPSGARYLTTWTSQDTGTTTITNQRDPNNGGATYMVGDLNGQHNIFARLDSGNSGGFGILSTGAGKVGLFDSTFSSVSSWNFATTGTISTNNPVSLTGGLTSSGADIIQDLTSRLISVKQLAPSLITSTTIGNYTDLSSEMLTNGAFTGNANSWTITGFTYATNRLNKAEGTAGIAIQNISDMTTPFVNGDYYKLTFTYGFISGAGSLLVSACGQTIGNFSSSVNNAEPYYFKCINQSEPLTFTATSTSRTLLDTISISKVQSGDLDVIGNITVQGIKGINLECAGGINVTKITGGIITGGSCL